MPEDDEGQEDDDSDEIVREIDVYLCPELSTQLHLVQFPLQAASSNGASSEMAQPLVAMIKPQHAALQLEYPLPNENGHHARKRIFDSYQVPVLTHMALGRFDMSGSALHLVPLSNVVQMRPSMDHIRLAHDDDEQDPDIVTSQSMSMEPINVMGSTNNVMFQRSESDKAATSRRSSYAYYQATKAAEPWVHLQVLPGPTSHVMDLPSHSQQKHNSRLSAVHDGAADKQPRADTLDSTASYVKSLNYIPRATSATQGELAAVTLFSSSETIIVEEFTAPTHAWTDSHGHYLSPLAIPPITTSISSSLSSTQDEIVNHNHNPIASYPSTHERKSPSATATIPLSSSPIPTWKKDLTALVTNLLQGTGVPIPYLVIRSRFPMISSHVSDEDLLEALSSCALLVRGNFVLKSALLPFSNSLISDARDLILLILNKYEMVHRDALIQVLCTGTHTPMDPQQNKNTTTANTSSLPPDIIHGILASIGRKTMNGVRLKVDDDTFVETYYPQFASLHAIHWAKKEQRFLTWIQCYEDLVVKNGVDQKEIYPQL